MKQWAYMFWMYACGVALGWALALTVKRWQDEHPTMPGPVLPVWWPPPGAVDELHREARRIIEGEWRTPEAKGAAG